MNNHPVFPFVISAKVYVKVVAPFVIAKQTVLAARDGPQDVDRLLRNDKSSVAKAAWDKTTHFAPIAHAKVYVPVVAPIVIAEQPVLAACDGPQDVDRLLRNDKSSVAKAAWTGPFSARMTKAATPGKAPQH